MGRSHSSHHDAASSRSSVTHTDDTQKRPSLTLEPTKDNNAPPLSGPLMRRVRRFQQANSGWRLGVFAGLCISTFVLLGNLALVFIGFRYSGYHNGIGILAQGRSASVARISTVYHVLINILSTLLLTSSNYCMQVLSSPSRDDIDRAHGEGTYVNIGILSLKNLRNMTGSRRVGWYILMLTSLPLHLLCVR